MRLRKLASISLCLMVAAVSLALMDVPPPALALSPGPGWSISSLARPTSFSLADDGFCQASGAAKICDTYVLTITNTGSEPALGPVTISDSLPAEVTAIRLEGMDVETGRPLSASEFGWTCSVSPQKCEYAGTVLPGDTLIVYVEVEVGLATGSALNSATVTGGGAVPVSTSKPLTTPTPIGDGLGETFGLADVGLEAHDIHGTLDQQADDHPYGVTATFHINTHIQTFFGGERRLQPSQQVKDIAVDLPLGFVGNPRAAARCTETQLIGVGAERTLCPAASRIGTALIYSEGGVGGSIARFDLISAVYNMVPEAGYPAQFGFKVFGKAVPLYASVVHSSSGYAVRVTTPGVPRALGVNGAALTFFGDPASANGDPSSSQVFFTNPGNCAADPLKTKMEADSWSEPSHWLSVESIVYPKITGCNLLQFEPETEMHAEVTQAEAPSGYEIKIKIPQNPNQFPVLATPQLKNVTMTLPAGMTISPGAGDGLTGCEATGPHGIDMPSNDPSSSERHPDEAGEGEAIGPDGMAHLVPGHCPQSSQIGTVEIATPVLESPLEGHVYVAQPQCGGTGQPGCTTADATNGNLFGIYLEAEGSGAVVKLKGSVSANPATGQLTARFLENPQLPVSEVTLHLKGGGRAPLANPRQCGEALANADLTPWSSPVTPDAIETAGFPVDWDGNGGPCPATLPFAPTLEAGATSPRAGQFGAFTLTVGRGDRQQDLRRLQVKLPMGVLGMLSKVPLCEEAQAAQGTCSEASRIGTTWVAAGSGPQPLWVQGRVYLTGPYAGAPFGLSIVVPAVAGPFNLGNVVVRSRIDAAPDTAQVTITSDPLPQLRDGLLLRIQKLNVAVDRENFTFNPTNCGAKHVEATLEAEQGASTNVSTPFAVEGCKNLPFKPSFKVSTGGHPSKALGASLDVKVTSSAGQANIGKVITSLPRQLPARLTTLQQACLAATFAQNPALCPAGSNVGTAKAVTPVLSVPLTGPAYLVSHGGAAFPDLVVILQGQGVRLDLTGSTNIAKGITTNTFAAVPDAPISSFELKLPMGRHSALAATLPAKAKGTLKGTPGGRTASSLCATKLTMPTTITGQNNARIRQSTRIAVTGCPRVKHKKH
jgi:hypothetical protein